MANRIDSLLCGLGPYEVVAQAWFEQFQAGSIQHTELERLGQLLANLRADELTAKACMAIIAALLNESLEKTGHLYRVNDDASLGWDYKSSDNDRKVMASLMAGH